MMWRGIVDTAALQGISTAEFRRGHRGAFVSVDLQAPYWAENIDIWKKFPADVLRSIEFLDFEIEFAILFYPWKGTPSCGFRLQHWQAMDDGDGPFQAHGIVERYEGDPRVNPQLVGPSMINVSGQLMLRTLSVPTPYEPISIPAARKLLASIEERLKPSTTGGSRHLKGNYGR